MAEIVSLFRGDDLPERHFDFFRFFDVINQTDAVAETYAVGICHDRRLSEHVPHDEVGAFSSHAGKRKKFVEIIRHPAAVFIAEHTHAGADVSCFTFAKTTGADDFFDLFGLCLGEGVDVGIFCVKILNHHIDPGVGALRRKAHADQKLPGLVIVQGAGCLGIFFF